MLKDVVEVKALDGNRILVRFEDGLRGEVDVSKLVPFEGVFEPLKDPEKFKAVYVNVELGVVQWENGADLDPDVLYSCIANEPITPYKT